MISFLVWLNALKCHNEMNINPRLHSFQLCIECVPHTFQSLSQLHRCSSFLLHIRYWILYVTFHITITRSVHSFHIQFFLQICHFIAIGISLFFLFCTLLFIHFSHMINAFGWWQSLSLDFISYLFDCFYDHLVCVDMVFS